MEDQTIDTETGGVQSDDEYSPKAEATAADPPTAEVKSELQASRSPQHWPETDIAANMEASTGQAAAAAVEHQSAGLDLEPAGVQSDGDQSPRAEATTGNAPTLAIETELQALESPHHSPETGVAANVAASTGQTLNTGVSLLTPKKALQSESAPSGPPTDPGIPNYVWTPKNPVAQKHIEKTPEQLQEKRPFTESSQAQSLNQNVTGQPATAEPSATTPGPSAPPLLHQDCLKKLIAGSLKLLAEHITQWKKDGKAPKEAIKYFNTTLSLIATVVDEEKLEDLDWEEAARQCKEGGLRKLVSAYSDLCQLGPTDEVTDPQLALILTRIVNQIEPGKVKFNFDNFIRDLRDLNLRSETLGPQGE